MAGLRITRRYELGLWVALLWLSAGACSDSLRNETITEANQEEMAQKLRAELSFEEGQLLQRYLQRTYPQLEPGQLPVGRSVAQMVAEQKAFEQSAASSGEASMESEAPTTEAAAPAAANKPAEAASRAAAPAASADQVAAPPPPPPPPPSTATVPAGTAIKVRLREPLSSKTDESGKTFRAALEEDLKVDGQLVAKAGSDVVGVLSDVKKSGKVKGLAEMSVTLRELRTAADSYKVDVNTLHFQASGTKKKDAKKVGIATGIGAAIGAIAGGGKGAAIGGAIGAGGGTGMVLATAGEQVEFEVEQLFEFKLDRELEMKLLK